MDKGKLNTRLFAVWSLTLFVVGLLGYIILLAFTAFEVAAGFLVVSELLALVFGIIGWLEKPGKVAVIGVCILMLCSGVSYLFFRSASQNIQEQMEEKTQELSKQVF